MARANWRRRAAIGIVLGLLAFTTGTQAAEPSGAIVLLDFAGYPNVHRVVRGLGAKYHQPVYVITDNFEEEIESLYARAEHGEIQLDTIIQMGHSLGEYFWGDNGRIGENVGGNSRGSTKFQEMLTLYPNASAQVTTVFLMGCSTAKPAYIKHWRQSFPSATFMVGFNGSAPKGNTGGGRFVKDVYTTLADAKRRSGAQVCRHPSLLRSMRRLRTVQVTHSGFWSCGQTYRTTVEPVDSTELRLRYDMLKEQYEKYLSGEIADVPDKLHDESSNPIRKFYNTVQELLGVSSSAAEHAELMELRNVSIRLIYFKKLRDKWWKLHHADVEAAGDVLSGIELFSNETVFHLASRKQVLDGLAEAKALELPDTDAGRAAARVIETLEKNLKDLDTPVEWIT